MTEKVETIGQASQLSAVNQSLERLSTQEIFRTSDISEASHYTRECASIQNTGAILKHGYRRRFGRLLGGVEEKEGAIGRKKILEVLQVPFKEAKKAINEAAVPEADYQRYIEGVAKKSKEITDAGALRAGKTNSQSRRLTAAARVIQKLSPWLNSLLIKSLTRGEYSGSPEEMLEAKLLLEKVSKQFADCASAIH